MKFIFAVLLLTSWCHASEISSSFSKKNYRKISEIYKTAPNKEYSQKELIYISYSLRALGFHRQDIKLNIRLIRKFYLKEHKILLNDLRKGSTIDGESYPDALKVLYWNLMNDYGRILEGYGDASTLIKKDHEHYLVFSKLLSELEFRKSKVDKFNDKIVTHIQHLENKVYKFSSSLYVQYVSWQRDYTLNGPSSQTGLVITNKGLCAGGDVGIENYQFHFYIDGCILAGSGGVSADNSSIVRYQQSDVPSYGLKLGPGASMIVSSSKSRIGIKLPMIYTLQDLQKPKNAGYSIKDESSLSFVGSLYSRWQFNKWYFQTEFGKYIQEEQTFWGLGFGRIF